VAVVDAKGHFVMAQKFQKPLRAFPEFRNVGRPLAL
jgi:hypothetical protein